MLLNQGLRGAWQAQGGDQPPGSSPGGGARYERLVMEAVQCFVEVGRRQGAPLPRVFATLLITKKPPTFALPRCYALHSMDCPASVLGPAPHRLPCCYCHILLLGIIS
jgi:hypothetical protein